MSLYQRGLGRTVVGATVKASDWTGWVWPIPRYLDNRPPVITDGYQRYATSDHRQHLGVDLMFERARDGYETVPTTMWPFPYGTAHSFLPKNWPAIAAGPGEIRYAGLSKRGHDIIIDHGKVGKAGHVTTYYQHLDGFSRDWKKGDDVEAGTPLGPTGGDIMAGGYPLHHLHFEIRFPDYHHTRDPRPYLRRWRTVSITGGDSEAPPGV